MTKQNGTAHNQPSQKPGQYEQKITAWCPRCRGAHDLQVFQSGFPLAVGQALLVLARCGNCGLVLWPLAVLPVASPPAGGGLIVPR